MTLDPDDNPTLTALRRTECCGCGERINRNGPINLLQLDKAAPWAHPVWTNVLADDAGRRAIAVMCGACRAAAAPAKTAVELRPDGTVVHHPVSELEDLPEITEADLRA